MEFKQAASRVVSALIFTLDLLLQLVYTVQPCNSLKTKRFRSLSPGGAETIKRFDTNGTLISLSSNISNINTKKIAKQKRNQQ
jgi:hypothetical protein